MGQPGTADDMVVAAVRCARCRTPAPGDDRYCERCGSELPRATWLASTGAGGACPDRTAHEWISGTCRHCGQRRLLDGDLAELDLGAADAVAALARIDEAPPSCTYDPPVAAARRLNHLALNAGGGDNITVVVAWSRGRAS